MKKTYIKTIYRYGTLFFLLIALYTLLMTLVYTIPNEAVSSQVEAGQALIQTEGKRPILQFGGTRAAQLDNFTDNVMFQGVIKKDQENPLESGMNVRSYARYWHGYQAVLRPLLTVLSYTSIRYLNIFVILVLLCFVFSDIKKKMGTTYSLAFLISQAMIYVIIFPMSMQYTTSFVVMSLAMLMVGYLYEKKQMKYAGYLFFITGSLVNFVDFLTYPLVTLGIPLIYAMLLLSKDEEISFLSNFYFLIKTSILWCLGYGLTWVTKWILSSWILNINVLKQATQQASLRTAGNAEYPTSPLGALTANLDLMFPPQAIKVFLLLLVVWLFLFLFFHKPLQNIYKMTPLLMVSMFPFGWLVILANHSEMHSWFTYRILAITVFGILSFMVYSIDTNKVKQLIHKKKY